MRMKTYGLLDSSIYVNRFHNLRYFNKLTCVILSSIAHVQYLISYTDTVLFNAIRLTSLRKLSLRFTIYTLSLLFLYFLVMSFSDSTLPYGAVNNSSNVQISKGFGSVKVAYENGTVIYSGTSDADAIQAALNDIDNGCIFFKKGIYSIDHEIFLKSNVSFIGNEGVTFNCFNGVAFDTGDYAYSSSTIPLSDNVASGDTRIELSSAKELNVGDYVKVSDDFEIFDGKYFKNGEMSKIIAIDGTAITVEKPLYDAYSIKDNAKIRKISMFENITFENIRFIGYGVETDSIAIYLRGVRNCRISNCEFTEFGERATVFWDCLDCTVERNLFKNNFKTGFGYSVSLVNACDNITIINNSFLEKGRHYIAVAGGTGTRISDGLCRNVSVVNNLFEYSTLEAINTHASTRSTFKVIDNEFNNCQKGVLFRNGDSIIINNTFKNCIRGFSAYGTGSHIIEENYFEENSVPCYPNNAGTTIKNNLFEKCGYILVSSNVVIDNNTFTDCSDHIIYSQGTGEEYLRENITISNNIHDDERVSSYPIRITHGREILVKNNHFRGCIRLDKCGSVRISGNRINTSDSYGIRIIDAKGTFNIISNEITAGKRGVSLESSDTDSIAEEINIFYNSINALTEVYNENYSKLILKK